MKRVRRPVYDDRREKRAHWVWGSLLGIWAILLTGVLADLTGSPGIAQSFKLRSLLSSRQKELQSIERVMGVLDDERKRLEENPAVQEREIRRVLGYAAKDELIFDFSGYNAKR